jgi:hypothetical protein
MAKIVKPTTKATPKPTVKPKVAPKATPKPSAKPSPSKTKINPMDELIKAGVKNLSPSQKAKLAKLLGIQYTPPPKPQPKGTYDPKRWEGVVGDKGW